MFIDKGNSYKHEFIKLHPSDETQSVKSKWGKESSITSFLQQFHSGV